MKFTKIRNTETKDRTWKVDFTDNERIQVINEKDGKMVTFRETEEFTIKTEKVDEGSMYGSISALINDVEIKKNIYFDLSEDEISVNVEATLRDITTQEILFARSYKFYKPVRSIKTGAFYRFFEDIISNVEAAKIFTDSSADELIAKRKLEIEEKIAISMKLAAAKNEEKKAKAEAKAIEKQKAKEEKAKVKEAEKALKKLEKEAEKEKKTQEKKKEKKDSGVDVTFAKV